MKENCRRLVPYLVPQDEKVVKLNQNESPFDVPPEIKEGIIERLRATAWNRYPRLDPELLRSRLADYTDFSPAGILAGSSSNEIIQTIMLACVRSADVLVVIEPGFSIYPRLGQIMELDVRAVPLDRNFRFKIKPLIEAARQAQLVMIASPNNPTGTALTREDIIRLANATRGYLAIDEAYYEFAGETCQPLLEKFERLMIIRTFSKAFGLAGVRLGYLMARPEIIEVLEKVKLPFSLGFFPQICGEELLRRPQIVRATTAAIVRGRHFLTNALKRLPAVRIIPSRANFILFQVQRQTARRVFHGLRRRGVLVRAFDRPPLNEWLRVTIGRPEENEVFLRALSNVLEET